MAFATIDMTKGITGTIPVANGGTGLASGTTGQFLKFTGSTTLAPAEAGGGKILQVQKFTTTGTVTSVTTDSFTATEVTYSLQPSATSSKIFVIVNASLSQYEGSGSGLKYGAGIYRQIGGGGYSRVYAGQSNSYGGYGESSGNTERSSSFPTTMTFVDAPNTTSNVDYKLYIRLLTASGQGDNVNTGASAQERSVTLMEIGA
tara:strand:- start:193 stop:801 length:609 start_codon:yes stop_codon:yes gene_type:complete